AQSEAESAAEADEAERSLARRVAVALPLGTLLIAIAVGFVTSLGPALLVFTAGALLGTITLLWASLRTLGGDAPLPTGLASAVIVSRTNRGIEDRKRTVLLALKDLEHERAIGKIDEDDYKEVSARYREEAKSLMRAIDEEAAPNRGRAEQIARAHLKKRGLSSEDASSEKEEEKPRVSIEPAPPTAKSVPPPPMPGKQEAERATCEKCGTSNEPDAAFCKKCGAAMKKPGSESGSESEEAEGDETSEKHADS
ncbi:MAG: zinc ribbon domain-containing protein, partial [Polyangiaceae bacterium]